MVCKTWLKKNRHFPNALKIFGVILFQIYLLSTSLLAQSYIDYYHQAHIAAEHFYKNNTQKALAELEESFKKVESIHLEKYQRAVEYSLAEKDTLKVINYLQCFFKQGGDIQDFSSKSRKLLLENSAINSVLDSMKSYHQLHQLSLDQAYIKLIDSLIYIDQVVVRKNKKYHCLKKYDVPEVKNEDVRHQLDSAVFNSMINRIQKIGFPSEWIVGKEYYRKASVILLHGARLAENEWTHSLLQRAVIDGKYLPEDFALMFEQYNLNTKGKSYFMTWDKNCSPENLNRLDSNRKQFGLKPLRAFKLKRKGLKMVAQW